MVNPRDPLAPSWLAHALLAASIGAFLVSPAAHASGSVGVGASGISQYGKLYKQGKSVFFRKLACNRSRCAFKRNEVGQWLAKALVASLATRDEEKFELSEIDSIIAQLCPGEDATRCNGRVDEQEAVQHYLSRRFRISQ